MTLIGWRRHNFGQFRFFPSDQILEDLTNNWEAACYVCYRCIFLFLIHQSWHCLLLTDLRGLLLSMLLPSEYILLLRKGRRAPLLWESQDVFYSTIISSNPTRFCFEKNITKHKNTIKILCTNNPKFILFTFCYIFFFKVFYIKHYR